MPSGCSMNILMKAMPERGFDVGIAEGHAVTFQEEWQRWPITFLQYLFVLHATCL